MKSTDAFCLFVIFPAMVVFCVWMWVHTIDQTQALREAQQKVSEQSLEHMKWSRPSDIIDAITEGK